MGGPQKAFFPYSHETLDRHHSDIHLSTDVDDLIGEVQKSSSLRDSPLL